MPVAPPPPPPPGPPPPPADFSTTPAFDPKGHDLLLKSIRAGTTLKKTVTKDRSAPIIGGKTTNSGINNNNNSNGPTRPTIQSGSATIARSNGLGALFADGIPKLKPTRTNIGQHHSQSSSLTSLPTANSSSLHGNNNHVVKSVEIGRKVIGTKNRGPPPQPPPLAIKPVLPTSVSETTLTPAGNTIANHTRSQSTVSLQNGRSKPGLLPKPPAPAPPPPNKRSSGVSRAHSMRATTSPSIVPQMSPGLVSTFGAAPGGGLKGAPMFHASTDSLIRGAMRPKPPLKAPSSRPPPPPRSAVPPPPPPAQPPPPPPPLPPHRAAPPLPVNLPPPLPTRHSSIRNGGTPCEFESRYIFHLVKDFPAPPPFRNVNKIYNSKTAKPPAPAPPIVTTHLQLNNKLYGRDSSNC